MMPYRQALIWDNRVHSSILCLEKYKKHSKRIEENLYRKFPINYTIKFPINYGKPFRCYQMLHGIYMACSKMTEDRQVPIWLSVSV